MSDEIYPSEPRHEERENDLYGDATPGTPKLAGIFFGVVILCAIFFVVGYKMGKGASAPAVATANPPVTTSPATSPKPSAAVPDSTPEEPAAAESAARAPAIKSGSSAAKPQGPHAASEMARTSAGNFAVQVAAVSRQEDADALENALRSKSYPVFVVNQPGDKLFHVQVGPFTSLADAEAMKTKLAGDGYNPILKK